MRYLIDTNIFVFYVQDIRSLDDEVRSIIEDYGNQIYISAESVKEFIHLFHCGKLRKWRAKQDIPSTIEQEFGLTISYIKKEHLLTMSRLEPAPNHNDPTDHLIIAQAITEEIPLISSDRKFEHYRKQKLKFIYNKR